MHNVTDPEKLEGISWQIQLTLPQLQGPMTGWRALWEKCPPLCGDWRVWGISNEIASTNDCFLPIKRKCRCSVLLFLFFCTFNCPLFRVCFPGVLYRWDTAMGIGWKFIGMCMAHSLTPAAIELSCQRFLLALSFCEYFFMFMNRFSTF